MPLSAELLAKLKTSKNKYSRSTNKITKPKEGKTIYRFLQKGDEVFYAELGVHWIKPSKDAKPDAVVGCHAEVYGNPCPVCDAIAKLKPFDDAEIALVKDWRPKKSVLFNVLKRTPAGDGKFKDELELLELTGGTAGELFSIIEDYLEQGVDILDPKSGLDFTIERVGKGLDTRYTISPRAKSVPVPADMLDKLVDLQDFIAKEFFKGDERKALNSIANTTGTTAGLTALTGPAASAPALAHATLPEADEVAELAAIVEEAASKPEPEVATVAEVPADEDDEEAALLAKLEAARKAKAAKAAAEAKAKAAATPAADKDEIDAMLADLE